ncbi:MAG: site-2 protease family protein [Candidatus Eremiobacteraeota bacterium]|nr:site-2 protease family protein [Candidatus Eremiobacteraeota bacterium]
MIATLLLALSLPSADALGKIVVFLVMLSILVVLHEGGHFLLARWNGVRVNDFAVGFGPTLLKWTSPRSGTNYRLNLLPIGGYCAMQGEDGNTTEAEQQREFRASAGSQQRVDDNFQSKSPLRRLSIVVAGPVANFILAFAIFFVAAISFGVASSSIRQQIGILLPNSPAMKAGLQMGDQVVAIDGKTFSSGDAMIQKIHASAGKPLAIDYRRQGQLRHVTVTPVATKVEGKTVGLIGFRPIPTFERVGVVKAVPVAADEFANQLTGQLTGYVELITHPVQHASSISGVIGMERAASAYQDLGWGPYLSLAAAISIALGVLNLFPFPALDGGRAVFIVAEMLRGRPVEPEKEALVHVTGFAVLMVLMVFVAYHDIANIVTGKGVF